MLDVKPARAASRPCASVTRPVDRRVRGSCASTVASGVSLLWADRAASEARVDFVRERFISSLQFEKGTLPSGPLLDEILLVEARA
jgi:hypothetical protein